jgi:hypothetical protein
MGQQELDMARQQAVEALPLAIGMLKKIAAGESLGQGFYKSRASTALAAARTILALASDRFDLVRSRDFDALERHDRRCEWDDDPEHRAREDLAARDPEVLRVLDRRGISPVGYMDHPEIVEIIDEAYPVDSGQRASSGTNKTPAD